MKREKEKGKKKGKKENEENKGIKIYHIQFHQKGQRLDSFRQFREYFHDKTKREAFGGWGASFFSLAVLLR